LKECICEKGTRLHPSPRHPDLESIIYCGRAINPSRLTDTPGQDPSGEVTFTNRILQSSQIRFSTLTNTIVETQKYNLPGPSLLDSVQAGVAAARFYPRQSVVGKYT
jgi:hypothetical protein